MSKALRISDLAVGDWVLDGNNNPSQILAIENWSDGYVLNVRIKEVGIGVVAITRVRPIPITPEILKNNEVYVRWQCVAADPFGGLFGDDETNHTKCEKFYKSSDFVIHSTLRGERFGRWQFATNDMRRGFKGRTVLANINYVHELQQALRLAGINKEIVL